MVENLEVRAREILEQTRNQISEAADDIPDNWFKINRYVYARLQLDERKRKPKKIDLFDAQKGICWLCKDRIENLKDTDLHRVDNQAGYDDVSNVVLVHRSCHQKMQARKT